MTKLIVLLVSIITFFNLSISYSQDVEYMPFESVINIGEKYVETTQPRHPELFMNLTIQATLPVVPTEMFIYKDVPQEISPELIQGVTSSLGIKKTGTISDAPNGGKFFTTPDQGIEFIRGSLNDFYVEYFNVKSIKGASLPSETELKSIAESHLRKNGLWHNDLKFVRFKGRKAKTVIYSYKKYDENFLKTRRADVKVLRGDKVKTLYYSLTEAPSYKLVKTITPEEAIERIYQGNAFFWSTGNLSANVTINECELYYESSNWIDRNDKSGTYSPVYAFRGVMDNGVPISIDVSAVADYYLKGNTVYANIEITPNPLSLSSQDQWFNCYIELPEGYNVSDIDASKIHIRRLKKSIYCDSTSAIIADYDNDGVQDLMVKFNMSTIQDYYSTEGEKRIVIIGPIIGKGFKGIVHINVEP